MNVVRLAESDERVVAKVGVQLHLWPVGQGQRGALGGGRRRETGTPAPQRYAPTSLTTGLILANDSRSRSWRMLKLDTPMALT